MGIRILLILLLLISIPAVSQNSSKPKKTKPAVSMGTTLKDIPAAALYSNKVSLKRPYFNKVIDTSGRGEVLQVVFQIENNTDDPMELYAVIIATYEQAPKRLTSFDRPLAQKERIWSFVPFPGNGDNFKYSKKLATDADAIGDREWVYIKHPKNPKVGVNPTTGKPYLLKDKITVESRHLSIYRKRYHFFNEVAILIFDKDGEPILRQFYKLKGYRR